MVRSPPLADLCGALKIGGQRVTTVEAGALATYRRCRLRLSSTPMAGEHEEGHGREVAGDHQEGSARCRRCSAAPHHDHDESDPGHGHQSQRRTKNEALKRKVSLPLGA